MINSFGNVFEGVVTPDGRMNGFCVTYLGRLNMINAGWHQSNAMKGNWMSMNADDLSIRKSGYYDTKRDPEPKMRENCKDFPKFGISNIFKNITPKFKFANELLRKKITQEKIE